MKGTGWENNERIRYHGSSGKQVILLHGGPAAYGDLKEMADVISSSFRAIEPWQRASGDIPLSVDCHVNDLKALIDWKCRGECPAIVGHSWGAMLALVYASEYPDDATSVVLVGCGTFDAESRARMKDIFDERTDEEMKKKLDRILSEIDDPRERLVEKYKIIGKLQEYEHIPHEKSEVEPFDSKGHQETWDDMVRLMGEGVYPAAFRKIKIPVMMLHGAYDPHPGGMIFENLKRYIPQLEYHEFERCGHYPWREKYARDEFYKVLVDSLSRH
jgi:pimeloyl-ACP methyl ester carboxylesterase